ncbi:MAG: nucleotidyltransferase [Burkholderiales bacterium]|nr:nucleotidyltransferase [Burkholderiales bacterium]
MNALLATAAEIQEFLQRSNERFCFIGGVALQRWGEPRFTRDVDITLLCPFGQEASCADRLLAAFTPRIPDAKAFALQNRVLLLRGASGIPIDIALGAIPFEERCVDRATSFRFGNVSLKTCSAEDLVVFKAFAGRDQDWVDIESIAIRQSVRLDWSGIFAELKPLAELRDGVQTMERLQHIKEVSCGDGA